MSLPYHQIDQIESQDAENYISVIPLSREEISGARTWAERG